MPQGYRNNALANNPYVGIDVDYFDRKALEKQQRHDLARENYSKFSQDIANQSYLDPQAREEYLKIQDKSYEDVLNKYSGNLSAGYQDILGAIEKSKNNPYHNLNKRHVEQEGVRQAKLLEYGAEAIDLSKMPDKLYTKKSDGTIEWSDPNAIGANVVKADDYAKTIEDMVKDLSAHTISTQSIQQGGSGQAGYLISKIQSGKRLSKQELWEISNDPAVQQAFLANASTSGIDNRKVAGTNMTYKDMFTNKDQLAKYIYGNIEDKHVEDVTTKIDIIGGGSGKGRTGNGSKTSNGNTATTETIGKNLYLKPLVLNIPFGQQTILGTSLNKISQDNLKNKEYASSLIQGKQSSLTDFQKLIGTKVNMSDYANQDLSFNRDKAKMWFEIQGKDPNKVDDLVDQLEINYKNYWGKTQEADDVQHDVDEADNLLNGVNNTVANRYLNSLSDDKKEMLKKSGINSVEDFSKFATNMEKESSTLFGKRVFLNELNPFDEKNWRSPFDPETNRDAITRMYLDFKDEELRKGVKYGVQEKALSSNDPNSVVKIQNDLLTNSAKEVGFQTFLQGANTANGESLISTYTDEDKGPLKDWLEENDIDPNNSTVVMSAKNSREDGLTTHIVLKGKKRSDNTFGGGKKGDETTYEIVNANLGNDNDLAKEISTRLVQQGLTTQGMADDYTDKEIENAFAIHGSTGYGKQVNDKVLFLTDPNVEIGSKIEIPFMLESGKKTNVLIKKLPNGYTGIIGGNPDNRFHLSNTGDPKQTQADLIRLSNIGIGKTTLLYDNPTFMNDLQYYGGGKKLPSVLGNFKKVKSSTLPDGYNDNEYIPTSEFESESE